MCCESNPVDQPDLQEVIEQLCDLVVYQLVMDVITFDANYISSASG